MLHKFTAFNLAKRHYFLCLKLRIPDYLYDQLMRASSSIALNLAEGSGKKTPKEQRRFYNIALGSLRECQAVVALADVSTRELTPLQDQLAAVLFTLSNPRNPKTETVSETGTAD